jgi:hypothetical protein
MWLSIVRSVMAKPGPWSRSMIESRLKTLEGRLASSWRSWNSVTVTGTWALSQWASQASGSSLRRLWTRAALGPASASARPPRLRMALTRATTSRGEKGLTT